VVQLVLGWRMMCDVEKWRRLWWKCWWQGTLKVSGMSNLRCFFSLNPPHDREMGQMSFFCCFFGIDVDRCSYLRVKIIWWEMLCSKDLRLSTVFALVVAMYRANWMFVKYCWIHFIRMVSICFGDSGVAGHMFMEMVWRPRSRCC